MKIKLAAAVDNKKTDLKEKVLALYPALQRYCLFLTGSPWDGEDLAQETIAKVLHRYVNKTNGQNELCASLLYRIAQNQWLDTWRKESKRKGEWTKEPSIDPLKYFGELYAALEWLAGRLTIQQAVIFVLKDIFDYSLADISKDLQITEGAVKASLFRTRNRIEKLFPHDFSEIHHLDDQGRKLHKALLDSIQMEEPAILLQFVKSTRSKEPTSPFQTPVMRAQLQAA